MKEYQICKRCVMDNHSDDYITFDENGYCNYCSTELRRKNNVYFPNKEGENKLNEMIKTMKAEGKGKKYDCMMGISGGLDSAYLAYLGSKWGLRILAVHIDDGFDTDIAKKNINSLCESCGIEIMLVQPDEKQFLELTRAYIMAEVPNLAVPQDNILFANLYKIAKENKIGYFLSGGNFALECILQFGNTHSAWDVKNIKNISKKFNREKINKLDFMTLIEKRIKYEKFYKMRQVRPLNYMSYNREEAIAELEENCGFTYYGSKHTENDLTKFTQLIWLPEKFNVDKRRSHYSSMIVSEQMSRDKAIELLKEPIISNDERNECIDLICKSLDIERGLMDSILERPGKSHQEYGVSLVEKMIVNMLRKK